MRFLLPVLLAASCLIWGSSFAATPCDPVKANGKVATCDILASAVTATGSQPGITVAPGRKTYGLFITTTSGDGSATGVIQGSLNGITWKDLWTVTVTNTDGSEGGDSTTDDNSSYYQYRLVVTAISGTGATVYAMVLR